MTEARILLTGAAGFVGGHLLPLLRAAFPQAALLPTSRDGEGGCQALDVTNAAAVAALVASFRPTACVHLAAMAAIPQARQEPALAWQINLHGTLAVAEAIRAHAPGCLLLFVSSADVYGQSFAAGTPLDEAALPAPLNVYAATKAAADLALGAMARDGLRAVRVRAFNHTGPGQSDIYVVAAFARQIARIAAGRQDPVLRVGALDVLRDFLDVRDVCAAYVACLQQDEALAPGTILNVASGQPRRIGDVLTALLAEAGVAAEIEVSDGLLRRADIPVACGDAGLARRLLGWRPRIAWDDTLRDVMADWQRRVQIGR